MKIEKCPFCGGEVKIDMLDSENSRNVKIYSAVHCPKCHEWFFKGLSKEKTVAAWNRRSDAEPVTRGKWEDKYHVLNYEGMKITGTYPTCNLCGHVSAGGFLTRTNYCPNCGARMEDKL